MTPEQGRRHAAVLLILTVVLWFHEWIPAGLGVAFVIWVVLHKRLEGDLGQGLLPHWRRAWPPAPLVLVPLLVAGTLWYAVSNRPLSTRVLPIALSLLGLSMVVLGDWWRIFSKSLWRRGKEPSIVLAAAATGPASPP